MERHEFRMDTRGVDRHNVSRRVKVLLGISLFLTGFGALGGTMSIVSRIREEAWKEIGMVSFCWNLVFVLILADSSFNDIFRSAITRSSLNIIAISEPPYKISSSSFCSLNPSWIRLPRMTRRIPGTRIAPSISTKFP